MNSISFKDTKASIELRSFLIRKPSDKDPVDIKMKYKMDLLKSVKKHLPIIKKYGDAYPIGVANNFIIEINRKMEIYSIKLEDRDIHKQHVNLTINYIKTLQDFCKYYYEMFHGRFPYERRVFEELQNHLNYYKNLKTPSTKKNNRYSPYDLRERKKINYKD